MERGEHRIVCAALRFADGAVVCSPRHYDMVMHRIIQKMMNVAEPVEQGFVCNRGEFWGRQAAFHIATAAKQIRHKTGNLDSPLLFSEDLY